MSVIPKRLIKSDLPKGVTNVYTTPASTTTQVNEIWVANNSRSAVIFSIIDGTDNTLVRDIKLRPGKTALISDCKIIMIAGEKMHVSISYALDQPDGTTSITAYGIEEVL